MKRLLPLALCLAACGGSPEASSGTTALATYAVVRSDLAITVNESGSLRSAKPVLIRTRERGVVAMVIEDGKQVQQGDLLLELDSKDLKRETEQTQLNLSSLRRDLATLESDARLLELEAGKTLADAERTLRFATLALEQYRDGKAQITRQEREMEVRRAQLEQADAEEKAARMPDLLAKGFINPAEARQAKLEADEKAQAARKAQRTFEVFMQFEHPQELAKLESEAESARIGLERSKQEVETKRETKRSDIERTKTSIASTEEELKTLQRRLGDLRILAPSPGIVVHGDQRPGYSSRGDLEIGEEVYNNRTVMTLPDLSEMVAEAQVAEVNIARVTVGMPAQVTVEGLGGRVFAGRIDKIATTAVQDWSSDAKRYLATVVLSETKGAAFRPDMTCRVEIQLAKLSAVLHVPVGAVSVRDGKAWCWVRTATGNRRQEVELGQASSTQVEVMKGLNEGDEVLVFAVEPQE